MWALAVAGQVELGEERAVAQLGDDDPFDGHAELVEDVLEEVVGHRPRGLDPLQGKGDRRRLGGADEDREHPSIALGFPQQHDRDIGGQLDSHADQLHLHHLPHVTP